MDGARTNQEPERMEQRNNDGHEESSLIGMACTLTRHKAYQVSGSYTLGDTHQSKDRFITAAHDEVRDFPPLVDGKRTMPRRRWGWRPLAQSRGARTGVCTSRYRHR